MWSPLLEPGLTLLHGGRQDLRGFAQELAHFTLHTRSGHVLWCDGEHGFDPYHFAELNLVRGHQADDGADRMLVKRCMTPFQWDSVLSNHLDQKLLEAETALVVVAPFDRLWSTDELSDWEAEDYVKASLRHLKGLARKHRIPILLTVDMGRWWKTHPQLAQMTYTAATMRWTVASPAGRWRLVKQDGTELDPLLRKGVTLLDFMAERPILTVPATAPVGRDPSPAPWAWRHKPVRMERVAQAP